MLRRTHLIVGLVGGLGIAVGVGGGVGMFMTEPPSGSIAVPSLTSWGKIFSLLLLAALGVAYLVWRRPIAQAQAVLETSPLGGVPATPLVHWPLYVKSLAVIELLGIASIWGVRMAGHPLGRLDMLGILTSGCIVAFVVHLLILGRSSGRDR